MNAGKADILVSKGVVRYTTKQDIRVGVLLDRCKIRKLIEHELFDVIEYAVKANSIDLNAYVEFKR